ncbi:MAG: 2-hydroxyacid dehydrogenase [Pseudomonadota bacterium]
MQTLFYSARPYDRESMTAVLADERHQLDFIDASLKLDTAILARGYDAVCGFVNDRFDAETLPVLADGGVRFITLRCTGFNNVALDLAEQLGIQVARVGEYSPYSVAEFTASLIQVLNRKLHKAYIRAREDHWLLDGLLGFDLHGKTVGICGTGKIGAVLARILHGFGCQLLGNDLVENPDCLALGMRYVPLETLLGKSDVVTLHVPLVPETHHMINAESLALMKPGAYFINTSRGGLVDTKALITALKSGHLGAAGLDVYEEESGIFFQDHMGQVMGDDVFARLLTFPNVVVTGHQGYFTCEALRDIARATVQNLDDFVAGRRNENWLSPAEPDTQS